MIIWVRMWDARNGSGSEGEWKCEWRKSTNNIEKKLQFLLGATRLNKCIYNKYIFCLTNIPIMVSFTFFSSSFQAQMHALSRLNTHKLALIPQYKYWASAYWSATSATNFTQNEHNITIMHFCTHRNILPEWKLPTLAKWNEKTNKQNSINCISDRLSASQRCAIWHKIYTHIHTGEIIASSNSKRYEAKAVENATTTTTTMTQNSILHACSRKRNDWLKLCGKKNFCQHFIFELCIPQLHVSVLCFSNLQWCCLLLLLYPVIIVSYIE